jgi:hypothetical protein
MRRFAVLLILIATGIFIGCTSYVTPEITPAGPNTYLLSRASKVMGWGNLGKMKEEVYQLANEFAVGRGKVMIPISTNEAPVAFGKYAFFELRFRLEDPDVAKETGSVNMVPIQPAPISPISLQNPKPKLPSAVVETKLVELKGLLDKGLITQEDFDRKKRELLDQM